MLEIGKNQSRFLNGWLGLLNWFDFNAAIQKSNEYTTRKSRVRIAVWPTKRNPKTGVLRNAQAKCLLVGNYSRER